MINENIPKFKTLSQIHETLHIEGCRRCNLGFQSNINGCCVSRGSYSSRIMVIGEAPGKEEDSRRKPFTGPAGQLMDRIFASIGINTNNLYITNTVKCRPVTIGQSNKQNYTPKIEQRERCNVYIDNEIWLLKPALIIPLGGIATAYIMNRKSIKMKDFRGKKFLKEFTYSSNDSLQNNSSNKFYADVFPMLHPAAILHAQKDPAKYKNYRYQTWQDIQNLKNIIKENKLLGD